MIARVWRFVRIGHAIVEITNEMAHEEYNGLLAYTEALENLLQSHDIPVPEFQSSHDGGGSGARHSGHNNKTGSGDGNVNILTELEQAHREELRQKYVLMQADGVDG